MNKLIGKIERRLTTWAQRGRSAGRDFVGQPDDVMLVSYPRSGNTWTRFLIANLVWPREDVTFLAMERLVPDIYKASREQLRTMPRPRVLKSHEYFDPKYRTVVYIVRDPRDVLVSYYHYARKTRLVADDYALDAFVERFLGGELDRYGSWGDNVASWLATRDGAPGFLLLRYEDMLAEPLDALEKIARHLKLTRTREEMERAVQRSSADEMRAIERRDAGWSVTAGSRKDIPFVRTAGAGDWASTLTAAQVTRVEEAWGPLMARLGYATKRPSAREA